MTKSNLFQLLVILSLFVTLTGCGTVSMKSQPWEPVYDGGNMMSQLPDDDDEEEDGPEREKTWRELRAEAYQAGTLGEAQNSLTDFLGNPNIYAGRIGEFEDAPHLYAVTSAQYELMRIYYLLGKREAGDAMFRQLDPLDLIPEETDRNPELPMAVE